MLKQILTPIDMDEQMQVQLDEQLQVQLEKQKTMMQLKSKLKQVQKFQFLQACPEEPGNIVQGQRCM